MGKHLRSCDIRKRSALTNLCDNWLPFIAKKKQQLIIHDWNVWNPYVKGHQTEKAATVLYLRDGPYILWTCTHIKTQYFSYLVPTTKFFFIPNRHVPSITTWKVSLSKFAKYFVLNLQVFDRLLHNASRLRYPETTLSWFDPSSLRLKNPSHKKKRKKR